MHHPPCAPHPLNGWIPIKYFVRTNKIHMFRSNPHAISINPTPIPINAHAIKLPEPLQIDLLPPVWIDKLVDSLTNSIKKQCLVHLNDPMNGQ